MSHSHSLWSDFPPFPLPQHIPSIDLRTEGQSGRLAIQSPLTLYSSRSDEQPIDPRTAGRSGPLAIQSPVTSSEPNTTEISSAEVAPII